MRVRRGGSGPFSSPDCAIERVNLRERCRQLRRASTDAVSGSSHPPLGRRAGELCLDASTLGEELATDEALHFLRTHAAAIPAIGATPFELTVPGHMEGAREGSGGGKKLRGRIRFRKPARPSSPVLSLASALVHGLTGGNAQCRLRSVPMSASALLSAAKAGDSATVRQLLSGNSDRVNARDTAYVRDAWRGEAMLKPGAGRLTRTCLPC